MFFFLMRMVVYPEEPSRVFKELAVLDKNIWTADGNEIFDNHQQRKGEQIKTPVV